MSGGLLFPSNLADTSSGSQQTFTSNVSAPALISAGLTGATAASRYVGATASGAPVSGTFLKGDFIVDQTGTAWVCTVAGTPGTWVRQAVLADSLSSFGVPSGDIAWGSHKITGLANGSASSDAAAFGQVPTTTTGLLPPGTILDYAASSPPTGFLACDGSAVSRATYAALFSAIGTTYGAGDGSTTFNVPDVRGRMSIGAGSVGSHTQPTKALAATGGSDVSLLSHTHTTPNHTHTGQSTDSTNTDHVHGLGGYDGSIASGGDAIERGSGGSWGAITAGSSIGGMSANASHGHTFSVSSSGGGISGAPSISTTSDSLSPYIAFTKIIKT